MKYFEVLYLIDGNYVRNDIIAKRDDKPPVIEDFAGYSTCKKILAYKETDDMSFLLNEQKYFKLWC